VKMHIDLQQCLQNRSYATNDSTRTGKLFMLVNAEIKTKMYINIICQGDT